MDCIRKPLQALRHDKSETPAEQEVPLPPEEDQQHHHRHHNLPNGDISGNHQRNHPDLRHPTHRYDVPKRHHIHTTDTELQTDFDLTDEDEPPPPPPYYNTKKHNQYPHQHRPRNNNPPPSKPNRYNTNRIKRTPSLDAYIFAYGSEKELAEDLYPIPLDVDLSPSEPQFPLPTPRGPPAMGTHDPTHNHHPHSHHHHRHRHYDDYDDYEDGDYYPRGRDPRPRENTNTKPPWAHPRPAAPQPPQPPPPAPASESTAASIRSDRRRVQANDARPRKRDSKRDSGGTGGGGSSATATSDFAYANGDGGGGGGKKGGRRWRDEEEADEGWPLPLPPAGRREKGGGGKVSINDEDYDYGGQWDGDDGGGDRDRDRGDVDGSPPPAPPPIFVNGTELSLRSKENLRDADADDAYLKPDAGGGRGRDPLWSPGWEVSSIHTFSGGEGDVDADGFVGGRGGFFDHARARRRNERANQHNHNHNHPYGFERAGGWRGGGEPELFDTGRNAGEWERGDWSPSPYASPTVSDDDEDDSYRREAGRSPHPNARRDRVKKKKMHHHDKHRGRKPERSPEPISPRTPAPPAPPTSGVETKKRVEAELESKSYERGHSITADTTKRAGWSESRAGDAKRKP
ncbi:hypothetical protein GTA08_BOTSDO00450 [Neofusicoccum parvum]|nr:hypothetical protein GTA08_BOTSDO00450 [Neofusicoccum parvum]